MVLRYERKNVTDPPRLEYEINIKITSFEREISGNVSGKLSKKAKHYKYALCAFLYYLKTANSTALRSFGLFYARGGGNSLSKVDTDVRRQSPGK